MLSKETLKDTNSLVLLTCLLFAKIVSSLFLKLIKLRLFETIKKLNQDITAGCDLQLWLNYRDTTSYNRVVVKKCNKQDNNAYDCPGCKRTLTTNNGALNQISWTLVASFESTSLNYLTENYLIDIKTSLMNANNRIQVPQIKNFWKNVTFPSLRVR